jgi:hypothetical protein
MRSQVGRFAPIVIILIPLSVLNSAYLPGPPQTASSAFPAFASLTPSCGCEFQSDIVQIRIKRYKLRLASVRPIGIQLTQFPDVEGHTGLTG